MYICFTIIHHEITTTNHNNTYHNQEYMKDVKVIINKAKPFKNHHATMHATNGNNDDKKHLNVVILNKGSSNKDKYIDLLKITVHDESPDILILPESNLKVGENTLSVHFPDFTTESKYIDGLGYTRISMLIRKSVIYSRKPEMENPLISTIWIKVKTGKRSSVLIMGGYRQWTLPSILNFPNSNHPDNQLIRYNTIESQIRKALSTNSRTVIGWDSNLDTTEENDPMGRPDTKAMYELYMTMT